MFKKHFAEVYGSIKLIDIEERFDIYFSRFFGLYFAKIGKYYGLTPTHVSLASLFVGVGGGVLFYFQNSLGLVALGSFLVVLAGVLDSSDGQLARMTGQSTDLGRVIDGVIDNFVFVAAYLGGSLYFLESYGWWIFGLMAAAGWTQSLKSALYEFYKSEYLQLVGKTTSGNIPLSAGMVEPGGDKWYHKFLYVVYKDYTAKQLRSTSRTPEWRENAQRYSQDDKLKDEFDFKYRALNKPLLAWWALVCGTNTHRTAAIVFVMMSRFDLFLWTSTIWTLALIPISISQKRRDRKLMETFEKTT
ncbi:MAG: CDP-alcohol phosphatidyltransferase family protein [Cyclobacteriaceae bacterium]